ncbi:MAG: hypothetical protein OXL40_07355 [Bacteroidota bacterium]|nr:hypothetical protein [Bacteroidota bacterium]
MDPIRIVSWNMAYRKQPWRELAAMDADVALLQETCRPPADLPPNVEPETGDLWTPWEQRDYDRWPMVVKLSDRVKIERFSRIRPFSYVGPREMAVSGIGTVAIARVTPVGGQPFVAVSMYARWITPQASVKTTWKVGMPDMAAHRIISDMAMFIGHEDPSTHRILAAGDLNMCYGTDDVPSRSLLARERTVWDRMRALGLEFMGPQYPAGRKAVLVPGASDTRNVVTYHTTKQTPETAKIQLDYAFASHGFHESIIVRAMNGVAEWGSSDHCRLLIEISE